MPFRKIAGGIAVLACFCLLVGLGLWQLQRLEWKEDLLAKLAQGSQAPAIDWHDGDKSPEFTHVRLSGGNLQVSPALAIYGRTYDGAAGVHVIALYKTGEGRQVIVDRGFVPTPIDNAKLTAPVNNAEIDGIVRAPSDKAWFEPENNLMKNQWYWMDLPAMGKALGALGAGDVAPVYVEAVKPTAANGPLPTGDRLANNLPNNHLQYAITWFSLACVLLVGYSVWLVRSIGKSNDRL